MIPAREPQWRRHGHGRRPGTAAPGPHAPVLELQRMAGNRAVTALLARDPKPKTPAKTPPKQKRPAEAELRGHQRNGPDRLRIGPTRGRPSLSPSHRGSEREAPTPAVAEVVITTIQGEHSTELFKRSLSGEPFSAEIVFVKDGKPYMKIKLTNALISSFSVSGHGGGADSRPLESWTLNADKIEYETFGGGTAAPGGG